MSSRGPGDRPDSVLRRVKMLLQHRVKYNNIIVNKYMCFEYGFSHARVLPQVIPLSFR